MKRLFSPLYALLFVALPQLIALAYLTLSNNPEGIGSFAAPVAIGLTAAAFFALVAIRKRREEALGTKTFVAVSTIYAVVIILSVSLGLDTSSFGTVISPTLALIAACMVSVIYGIMGIAYSTTSPDKTYEISRYVTGIFLIPLTWFFAFALITHVNSNAVIITLVVASFFAIILFAAKLLFIWRQRKAPLSLDEKPKGGYYIAVFVIAFCMPLLGLFLNQVFADFRGRGIFGDFSHPLFYIIAALNGLLLLVPPVKNKSLRLLIFYLKSVGYAYILYFFMVFIPNLPIGIFGIILYGLGLLVLAPLMITLLQGYHLIKEGNILSKAWSIPLIIAVFCIGIATLPLSMTAVIWADRDNFQTAVQYLEQKEPTSDSPINLGRLERTLESIKDSQNATRSFLGNVTSGTPIISAFYSRLILDGKALSPENVSTMENLFFDAGHDLSASNLSSSDIVSSSVFLMDVASETKYDEKIGAYRSWVHLKLKNGDTANGEYNTTFKLPEGAYVTDYYLDVLGEHKSGMLTDRRAALFIYSKIVNTRRDPGLLHYVGENTLELRVFPFAPGEARDTGFEIIHSQRLDLDIDNKLISLKGDEAQKELQLPSAVLLTAAQKQSLEPVVRNPKYYFVVDSSKNSSIEWHTSQIAEYANKNHIQDAEVIFASYKLQKHSLADMTQGKNKTEGGFNLNMAVKEILSKEAADSFPIIIAVSDNMPAAVLPRNMYALAHRFPESQHYYALNHNLTLTPYSFEDNKAEYTSDVPLINPVLDYEGVYVLDNDKSELVLTDAPSNKLTFTNSQYENAVMLDAMAQREALIGNQASAELVRASFRAKILTPQTAFIVVETVEQEKELLDLQERILNNNEEVPTVTLDEPPLILLIIVFMLVMFIVNPKLRRSLIRG